jgi:hypothetical protein
MPFQILHNPPGDASYSYLEKNKSISSSLSTSFLKEGSVDGYVRAQLAPTITWSVGAVVEFGVELKTQMDVTISAGLGGSGLSNDATILTSTATEKFQTSGNTHITGGAGDVFVGGALNMIYAVSDVLLYN